MRETLKYAAALRLPQHMSKEAKRLRVDMVIKALGLEACNNTIIGVPACTPSLATLYTGAHQTSLALAD